ncbi:MAG: hypothetical protein SO015_09085 [Wujia sp.]|nr:hypothetical protein [Wujia sp.]MCI7274978.1 DUF5050 domain-containing protein [Cuneatibacter sp.]MDY3728291.1 hypothetical protein [Wujia sp.]
MKNRKKVTIWLIAIIFLLSGCNRDEKGNMPTNEYKINAWDRANADVCSADEGYYVFCDDFLYTINETTVTPLCNKADCNHKNEDCNAYLKGAQDYTIWYDGNHIYVVGGKGGNTYSVYEIKKDGSGSKKLCDLFEAAGYGGTGIMCSYKDGYAYYRISLQKMEDIKTGKITDRLYRIRLEAGAKPELIYENQDDENVMTVITSIYFYEKDVYVGISTYALDNGERNSSKLYRYSTTEDTFEPFLDQHAAYYFIEDNFLWYTSEDGIHKYDLKNNTDEIFNENPVFCDDMYFDGKYIYLTDVWYQQQQDEHSDKKNIYVLDINGNQIKTISVDWTSWILFGDGNKIVVRDYYATNTDGESGGVDQYYFYDKSQIETEQDEWTCVEIKQIMNVE